MHANITRYRLSLSRMFGFGKKDKDKEDLRKGSSPVSLKLSPSKTSVASRGSVGSLMNMTTAEKIEAAFEMAGKVSVSGNVHRPSVRLFLAI